ncbi:MAG: 30S ribosomal protein S7 [Rickettsiales bacterium]|nr:30S ribosomal protein S7 [Rickettsiales bacterium]
MSRRHRAEKRVVFPDAKYGSVDLASFMNIVMEQGKKSVAEAIVYGALDMIKEKTGKDPIEAFNSAMENVMPMVEVRSRRVGGATYQVPMEVRPERRKALGRRSLVEAARKRGERTAAAKIAGEMMDAMNNRGTAVKKREDTHRMAEANRAFSHYRW